MMSEIQEHKQRDFSNLYTFLYANYDMCGNNNLRDLSLQYRDFQTVQKVTQKLLESYHDIDKTVKFGYQNAERQDRFQITDFIFVRTSTL